MFHARPADRKAPACPAKVSIVFLPSTSYHRALAGHALCRPPQQQHQRHSVGGLWQTPMGTAGAHLPPAGTTANADSEFAAREHLQEYCLSLQQVVRQIESFLLMLKRLSALCQGESCPQAVSLAATLHCESQCGQGPDMTSVALALPACLLVP